MSELETTTGQTLLELRRSFDQTFALLPRTELKTMEGFIGVRVAGDPYALGVRELGHLSAHQRIVPLPSESPELLGLAGIRGTIVPVYSLARMLGYDASERSHRWLVTCGTRSEMALAFETFEGYLRVPASGISHVDGKESSKTHVHELVRDGALLRAVVDIASLTNIVMNVALQNDKS